MFWHRSTTESIDSSQLLWLVRSDVISVTNCILTDHFPRLRDVFHAIRFPIDRSIIFNLESITK